MRWRDLFKRRRPERTSRRSVFSGAEVSRLYWDWVTSASTADSDIQGDMRMLRARARDLGRNNAHVKQYLTLLASNVIGHSGMKLQAQVRDNSGNLNRLINDRIESAWSDWGRNCSVDGRLTLTQLQHLALRTVAMDGEDFIRMVPGYDNRHGFALQLLDPDMIDHTYSEAPRGGRNEIRLGVEVDRWGRPVAYHGWAKPQNDINAADSNERIRIPADSVIHLYDHDRVNQTRGVTWLAPAMRALKMLDGFSEAALVAARTGAAKMGFFTNTSPDAVSDSDPDQDIQLDAAPGTFEKLPPGYQFSGWDPAYPSGEYPVFVKAMLRQISSGLRVSYNALANDLEGVNYSSIRSGLLIERDNWRVLQTWWVDRFLRPVYDAWLKAAMLSGGLKLDSRDPEKFRQVKWCPRGWAWVDPLKDVNAAVVAIQNGLGSRSEFVAEKGGDVEEILEELSEEQAMAAQYGVAIAPAPPAPAVQPADDQEDDTEDEEITE